MISKDIKPKHQKHTKLVKPALGNYGRNELAIIGTPCGNIKKLSFEVIKILSAKWKIAYLDADHKSADEDGQNQSPDSAIGYGANLEYTDKITFKRFDYQNEHNQFNVKPLFNDNDLTLINGNHFLGKSQIVIVDPKKYTSLEKKLDRLTDVQLLLLQEEVNDLPEFLSDFLENKSIPTYKITDIDAVVAFTESYLNDQLTPVNGLVLAGGKSTRMQADKGTLTYHGKPQREFMYEQMNKLCHKVYLSTRNDQEDISENYNRLNDAFLNLGPYGGILSAFQKNPNAAWLTVACDLPYLKESDLSQLIKFRNPSKLATCFFNSKSGFPEPLITIWEPRAYPVLLNFLSLGYSCPRKVLINTDCELLRISDEKSFHNVNYPEEYEEVLKSFEKAN